MNIPLLLLNGDSSKLLMLVEYSIQLRDYVLVLIRQCYAEQFYCRPMYWVLQKPINWKWDFWNKKT